VGSAGTDRRLAVQLVFFNSAASNSCLDQFHRAIGGTTPDVAATAAPPPTLNFLWPPPKDVIVPGPHPGYGPYPTPMLPVWASASGNWSPRRRMAASIRAGHS